MRLIDADRLKRQVEGRSWRAKSKMVELIDNVPTIEAEPVKHGRWIDCGLYGDYFPHHEWECSSCHGCVIDTDRPWYAYCPSCGARMDLEGEGHEQN